MKGVFFDGDLDVPLPGTAAKTGRPAGGTQDSSGPDPAPVESHYDTRKRQIPEELTRRSDELERLRSRQEDLEKQKQQLQATRRRMETFDEGRHDLLNKLGRSIVLLQREEDQAARMTTLCAETRQLFTRLKDELDALNSNRWKPESLEEELTRALARIESARIAYRKSLDRVNASAWHRGDDSGVTLPDPGEGPVSLAGASGWFWLKAGTAFALPLAVLLLIVTALIAWRMGWWV